MVEKAALLVSVMAVLRMAVDGRARKLDSSDAPQKQPRVKPPGQRSSRVLGRCSRCAVSGSSRPRLPTVTGRQAWVQTPSFRHGKIRQSVSHPEGSSYRCERGASVGDSRGSEIEHERSTAPRPGSRWVWDLKACRLDGVEGAR